MYRQIRLESMRDTVVVGLNGHRANKRTVGWRAAASRAMVRGRQCRWSKHPQPPPTPISEVQGRSASIMISWVMGTKLDSKKESGLTDK